MGEAGMTEEEVMMEEVVEMMVEVVETSECDGEIGRHTKLQAYGGSGEW